MGIARIETNEYTCKLCGYKWINRVNGKDGPIPKRCAKCKHQHWEKGNIDPFEKAWRNAVKKRFGYFYYPGGMFRGGWRVEDNAMKYLESRPSIEEMKVLLHPMSYFYRSKGLGLKHDIGLVPTADRKHVDTKATMEAYEYEKQLSRQLLKDFMAQRGIPYNENEAKKQSLYSHHGKYAIPMMRLVPESCDALKKDIPELSNEDIKARVLKRLSEELQYMVESPEELIQSCWPAWLKRSD